MTPTNHRTAHALACMAACIFAVLSANASVSNEPSSAGRGFGFTYDPAREVALVGAVKEVVTHHIAGSPMGLHVLISTSSGQTVDAHIGPVFSKQVRETLHVGELVQVVGVHEKARGKDVLLVRQLVYGGRQVTIRNERGFLVGTGSHPEVQKGAGANGGVR